MSNRSLRCGSRKREFSKFGAENFSLVRVSRRQFRYRGDQAARKKAAIGRLFHLFGRESFGDGTGWLGREDSNLRMAESKSDQFANDFNAHSEKISKFAPLRINRLANNSECR